MAYPRDPDEDFNTYPDPHPVQQPDLAPEKPDPHWRRGFDRYFRKLDKAVLMAFSGIKVVDEKLVSFKIPTIVGTMEKIVYAVYGQSSRAMQDDSGQYIKVRLPIVGVIPGNVDPDLERYVFHEALVWERYASERRPNDVVYGESIGLPIIRPYTIIVLTRYYEDHMQIITQIMQRFSSTMDMRIGGNFFPSSLEYSGSSNNFSETTAEDALKLYRSEISVQVKGWLPQPLRREKTVLGVRVEVGVGNPLGLGQFQKSSRFLVRVRPNDAPGADDLLPPR